MVKKGIRTQFFHSLSTINKLEQDDRSVTLNAEQIDYFIVDFFRKLYRKFDGGVVGVQKCGIEQ